MKRIMSLGLRLVLCAAGCSLTATSCAVDFRDALVVGAMDYISGTTTQLLSQLIILPDDAIIAEP